MRWHTLSIAATAAAFGVDNVAAGNNNLIADALQAYNVDKSQTSVSGLSSGAFFAVQMHVAFSDFIIGAGVFAGGPYDCAKGSLSTAELTCMNALEKPSAATYEAITAQRAKAGTIDDPGNLKTHNAFLFSGTDDTTVKQAVMDSLNDYYKHFITEGTVTYENTMAAGHTLPTDNPINKNPCSVTRSPYISDCKYDGAGKALNTIYSDLSPRNTGSLSGKVLEFSQGEFFESGISTAATGYVYVPASCGSGARCRLHISFHGCEQNHAAVGDDYVANTGFNEWADTNNIIVLYPQTSKSTSSPQNPNACWDWWGYAGASYDIKSGKQMAGVLKMIERVTSGHPVLPAPEDVHVTTATNSSISLQWDAVTNASGYVVQRDGASVANATSTSYTDGGLQSGTEYSYIVAAVDEHRSVGTGSAPVNGTTSGKPPPPPPIDPPTGLEVSSTTNTSITVTWDAETQAKSYKVYVDDSTTGEAADSPTYTQTGFAPQSQHSFAVTALDADGHESSKSASVTGTTNSSYSCQSYTASNYAHVQAGRAHDEAGTAYANGSNDKMGLDNTFYRSTLAETKPDYYIVGNCP